MKSNPMNTEPQAQPQEVPERIWLQWYGSGDPEVESGPVSMADVTWKREQIFKHDIEYVRADLPRAAADYKQGLLDALALAENHWNKYRDNKSECAVHIIDEIKKAVAATPRAQTGLTVEAAAKEIREILPDVELANYDFLNQQIVLHLPDQWIKYFGGNLDEAMQKVRAWAKSRAAAEREGESVV
jgi:hypothetical protein